MAITMMIVSAVISLVFLVDFAKIIFELRKDRMNDKHGDADMGGFHV